MFVLRACLCHTKWLHGWGSRPQSWSKSYPVVFHPIVEQLTVSISLDSFSSQPWAERARKVRKLCNLKPVTDRHTTTTTNSDQGPTSARCACIITSLTLRHLAINVPPNTPSRYKSLTQNETTSLNQDMFLIPVKMTGYNLCVSTWAIHFTHWYCITLLT